MANIFYSWQSDLPNRTNRGFIEDCLKKAIKELHSSQSFEIELNLDRDTKDESGTPDIVETIFKKIEKTNIFVADISIINTNSEFRKTPNPNVLLELGYAAKTLGWNRVICIFNTAFGKFEDLPFDLKSRKPISYCLAEDDIAKPKDELSKQLSKSISLIQKAGLLDNEVFDYLKVQVDTEVLSIISQLHKIFYSYKKRRFDYTSISQFVQLKIEDLIDLIKDNEILGFKIFKNWIVTESNLHSILDKPLFAKNLDDNTTAVIIKLIKEVRVLEQLHQDHRNFTYTKKTSVEYKIVHGTEISVQNSKFPDRYLLLEKDNKVRDFGDFRLADRKKLMNIYTIPEMHLKSYCKIVFETLQTINHWLELTGWEFIIDTRTYKRKK